MTIKMGRFLHFESREIYILAYVDDLVKQQAIIFIQLISSEPILFR